MGATPAQPPSPDAGGPTAKLMSLRGAVFLGIGAMVGAGIFALLGQAGTIAGSAVWISFLVAGLVSLALGYAMAKMGTHYPSSGGLITYLMHGFGNGRLVGVAAWLGYLTAIVVVGAMVAVSFGEYASAIVVGDNNSTGWTKLFASALVLGTAFVCIIGPRAIDRAQSVIVVALLVVFAIFVLVTLTHLDMHLLAPSGYPSTNAIVSSIALTFFAYLGFAVISFTGGDLENPRRNMPRAMYLALGVTTILYVAIAVGVFGTLTVDQVIKYGPTAIAEAVRPTLGDAGFAAMAVAALLATASSVTATLYASEGLTSALAEVGQFPPRVRQDLSTRAPRRTLDHDRRHPALRERVRPRRYGVHRQRRLARRLLPRRSRRHPSAADHWRSPVDPAGRGDLLDRCARRLRRRHLQQ